LAAILWLAAMSACAWMISRSDPSSLAASLTAVIVGVALLAPLSLQTLRYGGGYFAVEQVYENLTGTSSASPGLQAVGGAAGLLAIAGVPAIALTVTGISLLA